jgi:ABC-type polysaccharide/polyol phosphate transport system ATPase subunit
VTADTKPPAVVVDGVSKRFNVPHEKRHTLKERVLHPFARTTADRFQALRDVAFTVDSGEFFGIVGRNGSGKSTLLKCLAGIYRADVGQMYLDGRVSAFIELGVGFNLELAARDNVLINGVMLGLSPQEARERYESVIDFAELRQFEHLKLKNYSSGMQVRLAFSVLTQVDADILLIDEVLAVGDAAFQQKCFDEFHRLRNEGKTILFVTHDMEAVRRFCHRALLLEQGEIRTLGDPREVTAAYIDLNFSAEGTATARPEGRLGDGSAELVDAWWEDPSGMRSPQLRQGEACCFCARVRFNRESVDPIVSVVLENEGQLPLLATSTEDAGIETGRFEAGDEVVFSVRFDMAFAPGRIYASPWVSRAGVYGIMDRWPQMATAVVTAAHVTGALVDLPCEVRLEAGERVLEGTAPR